VGADFSMDIEIGGETFHKEPYILEQIAYRDTWGRGADSFIAMIYERLILMRDVLTAEGSLFIHCDYRVNAFYPIVPRRSVWTGELRQRDHMATEGRCSSRGNESTLGGDR
jgi:hypothetical protein